VSAWLSDEAPGALAKALVVAAISIVPLAAYAVCSRRVNPTAKLATVATLAAVVIAMGACGRSAGAVLAATAVGFCYFLLLAPVVYVLAELVAAERVSRAAALSFCALVFVLLPGVLAPLAVFWPIELRGWELMFAAYSYCADRKSNPKATLRECAFFVIVDPSLIFSNRAVEASMRRSDALLRCAFGGLCLGMQSGVFTLVDRALPVSHSSGYIAFMAYHTGLLVGAYCAASGRASLDIGLFGLLGYRIDERYDYPLAASNVVAFWRRWNRYVGGWFRLYVFGPIALQAGRSLGRRRLSIAKASAVLGTFGLAGALHDFSGYMRFGRVVVAGLGAFLLNAIAVVLWVVCTRRLSWHPDRFGPDWPKHFGRVASIALGMLSYAALLHVLVVTTWLVTSGTTGSSLFALP
jgi:hypothetical protein